MHLNFIDVDPWQYVAACFHMGVYLNSLRETNMAKYGRAAEIAVAMLTKTPQLAPRDAWHTAVAEVFPDSQSSQRKGCPRDTFLALCGAGVVNNVPRGAYTRSAKNKGYAELALASLRSNPELVANEAALWHLATRGEKKAPNYQMDVLSSLWAAGLVK